MTGGHWEQFSLNVSQVMHHSVRRIQEIPTRKSLTGPIISFSQKKFIFLEKEKISYAGQLRDFLRHVFSFSFIDYSMMTWADKRLTVNQIKSHPFFYGADWNSLRHIEPPFVPHLQSITDTSYFPTDDLGNMPDQLERVEGVGAEKDLAFLGYVILLRSMFIDLLLTFKNRFTFKRFTGGAQASG